MHALAGCRRSRPAPARTAPTQCLGVGVEQREVELELAREVLVEHGLGDAGPLGDVVHRGGVVAVGDEHLLGRGEQLLAARRTGQPAAAATGSVDRGLGWHAPAETTCTARGQRTRPRCRPGAGRASASVEQCRRTDRRSSVYPLEHLAGGELSRSRPLDLVPGQRGRHRRLAAGPAASTARRSSWPGCSGSSRRTPCRRAATWSSATRPAPGCCCSSRSASDVRVGATSGSASATSTGALTCMPLEPDVFGDRGQPVLEQCLAQQQAATAHSPSRPARRGRGRRRAGRRRGPRPGRPPATAARAAPARPGWPARRAWPAPRRRRSRSSRDSSSSPAPADVPAGPSPACPAARSSRRRSARRPRWGSASP